jgi:hypothetical protein
MSRRAGRKRPSAKLTELVDRAADVAADLGDRTVEAALTTVDLAVDAISSVGLSGSEKVRPLRRRNSGVGATRRVAEATAKTNRKLAQLEGSVKKKNAARASLTNLTRETGRSDKSSKKRKR